MAGSFLGTHRANILEEITIPSWRNVKRGQIISATYRSETTQKTSPKMYLVLHPQWPKNASGKMHVLDISYIKPINLKKKLINHTVQKKPLEETFRNKTYSRLDFGPEPRDLYRTVVKRLINDGFGPSYRTIIPQNLSKIRAIDYEWYDSKQEDAQGVTKEEFNKEQKKKQAKEMKPSKDRPSTEQSPATKGQTPGPQPGDSLDK